MLKASQRHLLRQLPRCGVREFSGKSIVSTDKFAEIYHNTDSIDNYYETQRKPEQRIDPTKRAAQYLVLGGMRMVGVTFGRMCVLRFVQYWSAGADVLALATTELDISSIRKGTTYVCKWRGSPVFITHRTAQDIEDARKDDNNPSLRDPETDAERCPSPEWHVAMAVCTHFGCVPIAGQGDWGGYFCPCHGSHYDKAGRARMGPAPLNLPIPPYKFLDANTILIGD